MVWELNVGSPYNLDSNLVVSNKVKGWGYLRSQCTLQKYIQSFAYKVTV